MAYAPHTNTDVHQHLIANATVVPPLVLGVFVEKSYGKTFEYAERRWPDDQYYPNLPHIKSCQKRGGSLYAYNESTTPDLIFCIQFRIQKWTR